jgi:hypothetical protein
VSIGHLLKKNSRTDKREKERGDKKERKQRGGILKRAKEAGGCKIEFRGFWNHLGREKRERREGGGDV